MMIDIADRVWALVDPYVAAEGVELDDVEVRGRGSGTIVRVVVDAPEPIGVDRIARLSRAISRLLDEADPIAASYTLEVSSPGLERTLRRPRHYEKSIGRQVKVRTLEPVAGALSHTGVLRSSNGEGFVVEVDGEDRRIPYEAVKSAKTIFVWERAAKPGHRR